MGVAAHGPHSLSDIAPRAPLLKFLEITPAPQLTDDSSSIEFISLTDLGVHLKVSVSITFTYSQCLIVSKAKSRYDTSL